MPARATPDSVNARRDPVGVRAVVAVGLVSAAMLGFELSVVRLFDVVLDSSYGYLVLTCALFAMGIAGVAGAIRPVSPLPATLARLVFSIAVTMAVQVFVLDLIPFDVAELFANPATHAVWFAAIFATVAVPFFYFGRFLITVFVVAPRRIGVIYAVNPFGSGVGCLVILPLIPALGPGGSTLVFAALATVAWGTLCTSRTSRWIAGGVAACPGRGSADT